MSARETKRKGRAGAGLFVSDVKELRSSTISGTTIRPPVG
jgi:hypothetical protein